MLASGTRGTDKVRRYYKGGNTGYQTSEDVLGAGASVRQAGQSVRNNTIKTGTGAKAQMDKQKKIVSALSKQGPNIKMAKFAKPEESKNPATETMKMAMEATKLGKKKPVIAAKKGGKTKSRVNQSGNYTKPSLRKRIFNRIKAGGKGGRPGQWSARKAQMLASAYKKAGGGYKD